MPEDLGEADAALAAALATGSHAQLLAALAGARVFAALSAAATAEQVTEHGLRAESSAEMAVLLLEVQGSRALPVFSSVAALHTWRPEARPVPLSGPDACRAALEERAVALVVDPGGASRTVPGADLRALAEGYVPIVGSALASRRADVELRHPGVPPEGRLVAALGAALAGERLRDARLLQGPNGLVLGVSGKRPLGPAELAALAQRVMTRLGDDLPSDGLDLAEVPSGGPGVVVTSRRGLRRSR